MVGNGREWSGVVGSGRERLETVLSIPSEGFQGPIEEPGMVGSGREWSGAVGDSLKHSETSKVPNRRARNGRERSPPLLTDS